MSIVILVGLETSKIYMSEDDINNANYNLIDGKHVILNIPINSHNMKIINELALKHKVPVIYRFAMSKI